MNARVLAIALVMLGLFALQFTLRPLLDWRAGIDFLVIAILVVAIRVRPGAAALAGFCLGLLADSLTPEAFGAGALAGSVIGYTASRLKAGFFVEDARLNATFVFGGKVVFDLIFIVAERRLTGRAMAAQLLVWTPVAAIVTALVGVLVMALLRPTLERRRP